MTRKGIGGLAFAVAIVLMAGWLLRAMVPGSMSGSTPVSAPVPALAALSPNPPALAVDPLSSWAAKGAALGALPASLVGTQIDGALRVDGAGQLVVDLALRRLFDYFLATAGEESLDDIRARLAFYFQQQLSPEAALQAWNILNQYLDYRDALADIPGHDGSNEGMLESLQRQRELRDALLGTELASAFFQAEDQYADYALQHVALMRDNHLSASTRQQQIDLLLNELPETLRDSIQATAKPLQVEREVASLRQQGASEAEVWQQREQQFGADAADRLAQLDQQRARWQQRYEDY